jgi:zinc finger protein AEBP2
MSNRFKNNSRFGSLVDEDKREEKKNNKEQSKLPNVKKDQNNKEQSKSDQPKTEKPKTEKPKIEEVKKEQGFNSFRSDSNSFRNDSNSFRNDGNSFRNNRNYRDKDRYLAEYAAREEKSLKEEKERIEAEKLKALEISNFPSLLSSNILPKIDNTKSINFLEKVTTNNIKDKNKNKENGENKEEIYFKNLPPGWSQLKRDPITKQTIIKSKVILSEKQDILTESDIVYNVFTGLTDLYECRKQQYIDNWGEDEYEKMFKFPNYDYEYFDKLDEKYEKEMEKYSEYYNENNEYYDEDYYE